MAKLNQQLVAFAEALLIRMNQQVNEARATSTDEIQTARQASKLVRSKMIELYDYVLPYEFYDDSEEVLFFRTIKPKFLSQHIYFQKLLELTLHQPLSEAKKYEFYQSHIIAMQEFREQHYDFYAYCLSEESHFDKLYFTRQSIFPDLDLDRRIATGFDIRFATLIANDRLCHDLLHKNNTAPNTTESSTLTWTASKSALIELTYALKATEVFNDGKTDLKHIATTLEKLFHINLGNYYRVFQDIRLRKSGQTNFIDQLKEKLTQRMGELD